MTGKTMDEVRATMERLEKFELPESFRESPRSSASFVDSALLRRYTTLRDHYLKKSIDNTVVAKVVTFDGETFEMPELPIKVEEMEARQQKVQNELFQTARTVQSNWDHLQADYARLQQRKEDLRRMLEEFEGDGDSLDIETAMEETEESVEDEDLESAQNRILALQQRKKELLAKLHRLQEENRQAEIESTEAEANLSSLSCHNEKIAEIEKENQNLRAKIESNQEMVGYFETMRQVTEEVHGLRVLSVEEGKPAEGFDVVLRLEILHAHEVEIGLKAEKNSKECLRVVHATLTTPPVVKIATGHDATKTIELPIPVLSDLVTLSEHMPRAKALPFVLEETRSRIEMIHERASELCDLVSERSFLLERSFSSSNSYGRCDHEVVCTLPEHDVKVLVRMTPDCPRIPGSVYVDEIKGPEGVDLKDVLELTKKTSYKRPVELLREVKNNLETRKQHMRGTASTPPRGSLRFT